MLKEIKKQCTLCHKIKVLLYCTCLVCTSTLTVCIKCNNDLNNNYLKLYTLTKQLYIWMHNLLANTEALHSKNYRSYIMCLL